MNSNSKFLQLDPRGKLLLLLLANIVAFTYEEPWVEIVVIGLIGLLQIASGLLKSALKWVGFFTILVGIQYFFIPLLPKFLAVIFTIFTVFARRIFPCMMIGSLIIQTTPVRYFIVALRKWKVPQTVIIPLAVTLRYFPAIKEEHRHIHDAMKLKEIKGFGNRIQSTILPLLVSAIQTSDELSAAAITRGIENPCEKTSTIDLRFHIQDIICLLIGTVLSVYTVFIG